MRSFFLKTDTFWIFSRILFVLVFLVAAIITFFDFDFFQPGNVLIFSILGIYLSFLIALLIKRAYKKPISPAVPLSIGIISILIGVLMSYSILTNHTLDELLKIAFHFAPIWILLLGFRDILLYRYNYTESEPPIITE